MAQPTANFGNRSVSAMSTRIYAFLKRRSTSAVSGITPDYVRDYVATWDAWFCDYARWTFRRTSKVVAHWQSTSLYSALATSDLYAELTTNANIPTSGRMWIEGDEIDYSAKDSPTSGKSVTISTASGAKTADLSHLAGAEVRFLPALPSDCGKIAELWRGDSVDPARTKLHHLDNRQMPWPPSSHYFLNDGYIYLPRGLPSGRLFLVYYKKAMKAAAADDLQTPEKYDNFVLWAALAQAYQVIGNAERAEYFFAKAGVPTVNNPEPTGLLQSAVAEDAEQTDSLDEVFHPAY